MGRYKRSHNHYPLLPTPWTWVKESKIQDKETGNTGKGLVWDNESYEKADRKAWRNLQEKNRKSR